MKLIQIVLVFLFSISAFSQTLQSRVLVIRNTNSQISMAVADDYMLRRNVNKVLNINCNDNSTDSDFDYLDYQYYVSTIENPIKNYLLNHPEIDFIVFTKGIPIHIYNAPNKPYNGLCSIDSRISALGYENSITSRIVNISDLDYGNTFVGQCFANKFWNSSQRFSHSTFGGYLVTRLDGYSQDDAISLTTRSLQAEANMVNGKTISGDILLDACADFGFPNEPQPYSIYPTNYVEGQTINITTEGAFGLYNVDMQESANDLISNSIGVQFEKTNVFIGNINNLKGYVSWGSNDTNYNAKSYNSLGFSVGALGETAVSTSARTFLPTIGGQSLIANLISQGITGIKGYTDEPLLVAVASPKILFNRYTNGWTLAESFYAASRLVGWMDLVIGDPICRAYANNLSIKNYKFDIKTAIYPNPSEDFIKLKGLDNIPIFITDILGKTVLEISNYKNEDKIDISKLEKSIYFIRSKNLDFKVLKFLKK